MSSIDSPISLSEIESVLSWVDAFKLSRPTKKINRDFSDAVLLAEILSVHYPKLVEMHNYPPRNSHSLKLNNWMTLNRKVLKKLKLNLCCNTMEQLANCAPGVIERVLVMVRDKIRRDDDAHKGKDSDQNLSSGGSYYEACGEDEHVLLVPVKTRVNGVLETIQQKVVSYDSYLSLKEELKDAKESSDVLKQKVEHLDSLLKLKEERIDELQKQLERKQVRRKEAEAFVNSLAVPFETVPNPAQITIENLLNTKNEALLNEAMTNGVKTPSVKSAEKINTTETIKSEAIIPIVKTASVKSVEVIKVKSEESKIPIKIDSTIKIQHKKSEAAISDLENNLDRIKSDVFKEIEIVDDNIYVQDADDFKDTVTTIEETIQKEVKMISDPMEFTQQLNC